MELALGLMITENMADKQIALTEALVAWLPKTVQAMERRPAKSTPGPQNRTG
ncbi:hypothetical protein [Amycolatopsis nigrescens]|uniref:hypothetical protein n=1 Tax=Amycolatopsis nigrescens TaxID=381445 RepID=UPI000364CCA9|nr:hypothetical protein [Amycolatopsis nigrescens]